MMAHSILRPKQPSNANTLPQLRLQKSILQIFIIIIFLLLFCVPSTEKTKDGYN